MYQLKKMMLPLHFLELSDNVLILPNVKQSQNKMINLLKNVPIKSTYFLSFCDIFVK